jgi:hypothetical protein
MSGYGGIQNSVGSTVTALDPNGINSSVPNHITGLVNLHSGSFNGSTSYVDLGTTAYAIQRTQAFTMNAWVKPSGTNGYIFTNRNPSNSFIGIGFGIKTNGHLFANLCGASTTMQVDSLGPVQGIYSMVTWTNDGSSTAAGQKLYINAVLQTNTVDADNLSQTILGGGNACLGASSAPGTLFTGLMDEWSYKASVLDQSAITTLFNQGRPGVVTADHLYRFENSGVSLTFRPRLRPPPSHSLTGLLHTPIWAREISRMNIPTHSLSTSGYDLSLRRTKGRQTMRRYKLFSVITTSRLVSRVRF